MIGSDLCVTGHFFATIDFGGNRMRKAQKQDIMDMLQTLHEAHEEIKNNIDRKNYILAQDLLGQCQEGAISIGTAIEAFEGEGFVTVGYIETYCDVVFKCHEELNGSDANANKLYKNLKKQLLRVESSVKNDIHVRKEVAFFPYKASMWDSLESVYLAAKEDPDCDAYCVPIPYYDRNPDRSLGQMHYEGTQYPKNIEVIDWQTYNFEERKPDAIYIHNPYDDWNLVTCVHPRYFSNNLKKYTDKLVYIPYFVLDEIEPDDQARIDGMKHFIWTPGIINADKVIVQSEKMKQIYVNEYLKAAQANGLQGKHIDRNYLEEKFLGLGSPKFDKVLNTKKEDLEIPEDWLRIIQKPDGSWKKIIFYNTSIAALLEHNEKMLEKMKDVFKTFKENQDEVALLWRPHPLIKTTVSAMRPQLWAEYEKLVNQYKQGGWGIYDDTSDMDRAVVLSDAYYGDGSSVVHLYKACNKQVLIQNVDFLSNHTNGINIQIEAGIVVDNMFYYTIPRYNKFFCTDLKNKKTKCIKNVVGRRESEQDRFNHATVLNSVIFFMSDQSYEYAVLNTKTEEIREGYLEIDKKEEPRYLGAYNQKIFLVNKNINKIYILWNSEIKVSEIEEGKISSEDSVFYFFERDRYVLWKISVIEKRKEKVACVTKQLLDNNKFSCVVKDKSNVIFVPDMTDEMITLNLLDGNIRKIRLPDSTVCLLGGIGSLRYLESSDGEIIFSSVFSSNVYMYNKQELVETWKIGIGRECTSFNELLGDLIKRQLFNELYMDLSVYLTI